MTGHNRLVINRAAHILTDSQRIPKSSALHLYIRKHLQKTAFRTRKVKQKPEITEFRFRYEISYLLLLRHGILHPNHENRKGLTILMYGCTYYPGSAFLSCPPLIYTLRQVPQLRFATNLHICPSKRKNRCADSHIEKEGFQRLLLSGEIMGCIQGYIMV